MRRLKAMVKSFLHSFNEGVTTNRIQLGMISVTSFCCLIPLFLETESYIEETSLRKALSSRIYRDSAIAVIALAIPLLMDTIADMFNSFFKKDHNKIDGMYIRLNDAFVLLNDNEKIVFLVGLLILPITALLPSHTINLGLIYVCCQNFQFMMVAGIVFSSLCRYDRKVWSASITYLCICLVAVAIISKSFVVNLVSNGPVTKVVADINAIFPYFFYVTCVIFFICTVRWLTGISFSFFRRSSNTDDNNMKRRSNYFPLLFIAFIFSALAILLYLSAEYPFITDFDENGIVVNMMPYLLSLLFVSFATLRMVKFEVIEGLVSQN